MSDSFARLEKIRDDISYVELYTPYVRNDVIAFSLKEEPFFQGEFKFRRRIKQGAYYEMVSKKTVIVYKNELYELIISSNRNLFDELYMAYLKNEIDFDHVFNMLML
jgi:hypothetical protein